MTRQHGPGRNRSHNPRPTGLYKNRRRAKISGVCAGVAEYLGIEPILVRAVAVCCLIVASLPTLVGYFIAAWLLDDRPDDLYASPGEETFWREVRTATHVTTHDLGTKFQGMARRIGAMEAHVTSPEFDLNRKFRDLD